MPGSDNRARRATRRHLLLLSVALASSGFSTARQARAQAAAPVPSAPPQADGAGVNLGTVPVTARANSDASASYASPKVSFGPFGDTSWQDVPFRTFSVPQQVIQDQQAHTPYETIRNDPSVNINFSPTFTPSGTYIIRGFQVDTFDMKLDGLPIWTGSAVNGFAVAPEGLERVDVLTGAPAVLYGFAAPAGVINFISKKPLDAPLTNFTLQYNSRLNVEEALDVSRRFGKDDQFGIRLNFAQQDGSGPIDHTAIDRNFFGLALDWKPVEGLRVWSNFQENYRNTRGTDPLFGISSAFRSIPDPPNLTKLYGQPWYYNRATSLLGEAGVQYDKDDWHFALSGGETRTQLAQLYNSNGTTRLQPNETYSVTGYYLPDVVQDGTSFNIQGSRKITTGAVSQTIGLNYTQSRIVVNDHSLVILNNLGQSSLLDPVAVSEPIFTVTPRSETIKQGLTTSAFLITDRIDVGQYVTVLAGADVASVYNSLVITNPNSKTSQGQSQTTPLVALEVHPLPWVTAYFSYIQALEQGSTAPTGARNFGTILSPYVGDQYEVGVKANINDRLQVGADVFRISQQNAILDPADNVYKADGTARSQGVEFTVAGQVTDQFKVLGGATVLNAQALNPTIPTGTTKVQGVPDYRLTLFGQYAVRQVPGLSLLGGLYFTGALPVTQSLSTSPFATFDVGTKYDFTLNNTPVTASLYVQNILNNRYWISAAQGQLGRGTPLQASAALTMRF